MSTGWDIRYFISTSGQWPPSLIYDIHRHRTVFPKGFPCHLTPKHGYSRWNFVAIMYRSLDIPCTNVDTCISGLTATILNFWVISACVTIDKDLLEFTQQKPYIHCYIIQPYHVYQVCLLRAAIILILDEFRQSKFLIWSHFFWGHVVLRSWNRCCPVENLFVHKVQKNVYLISLDKKVTQQRVLWGVFSLPIFATQGLASSDSHTISKHCSLVAVRAINMMSSAYILSLRTHSI